MKNKSRWDSLSMRDRAALINMYTKGGYTNIDDIRNHYNSFGEGGEKEKETSTPWWQKVIQSAKETDYRDTGIGASMNNYMTNLYLSGKEEEAKEFARKVGHSTMTGLALGAGVMGPAIAGSELLGDLAVTSATTLGDALFDWDKIDWRTSNSEDVKNLRKDYITNIGADLLGHGVGKLINKGIDLYKAKNSVSQIPENIFENAPGLTYEGTPRLNSPSPTLGLPPHRNPVLYFEHSGSRAIDRDAYERLLRDANFNEGSINNLLREFDDRIRSRSIGSNEDFLLYRYPVNGTMTLDPMLVDFKYLNLPQGFRTPNSTIMYNGTPLTRQEAIDYLTSRGFNDAYIENKLNLFDTEFYNQNTPSSVFPSIDFDLSGSAYGPGHLSDATESFIRNNVDRYEDTILRRSFTAEDAGGVRNEFNFANSITNKTKKHRILTEELSKKYPELKPYLQEGKPIDDTLRKFLWDKYGLESPLNIDDMTWFQGNAGAEYIWGREPMYKKLVRDKDGNLVEEIRKESPGKRQAGLATLKYIKEMPRHTAITVTNTSLDSELLKLNGAVRNYGTGPGQTTVEIMPSGYSLGNDHHLERIYLEDILNDGNIDPSEVSTLRDYMDKRRNGARANIPDISSLPTFSKAAEDYYYKYTKKHMVDRLSDYWEQIKKLDSRYENVEMPSVGDFDLTKLNTILYTGEYSPYIKRTPVAVVKHKDGGKLNKFATGGYTEEDEKNKSYAEQFKTTPKEIVERKALNKVNFKAIPDSTFTRENTGHVLDSVVVTAKAKKANGEKINSFDDGGSKSNTFLEFLNNVVQTPKRAVKGELMDLFQLFQHGVEAAKDKIAYNRQVAPYDKNYFTNEYEDPAQTSFLFSRKEQERAMLNSGYIKGTPKDYGLVAKAVGNRDLPVYQKQKDDAYVGNLRALGNIKDRFYGAKGLEHAGSFPTTIYADEAGNIFQKAWDLQDYGVDSADNAGTKYDKGLQQLANVLDFIGNPIVRTTGLQKLNKQQQKYLLAELKRYNEELNNSVLDNSSLGNEIRFEYNLRDIEFGKYKDYINSLVKKDKNYHAKMSHDDICKIREEYQKLHPFEEYIQLHHPEIVANPLYQNAIINTKAGGGKLNKFEDGGEKEQDKPWYLKLAEAGQAARDARIGAVGAQQVRDLAAKGKIKEAEELATKYFKANTAGMAFGTGMASTGLLGDLAVTIPTSIADSAMEGLSWTGTGSNLLLNVGMDVLGNRVGKYIDKGIDWYKGYKSKNLPLIEPVMPTSNTPHDTNITTNTTSNIEVPEDPKIVNGPIFKNTFNLGNIEMSIEDFVESLRRAGIGEKAIAERVRNIRRYQTLGIPVEANDIGINAMGTIMLDTFNMKDFNIPDLGNDASKLTLQGNTFTRKEYAENLKSLGYNDEAIKAELDDFDYTVLSNHFVQNAIPSYGELRYPLFDFQKSAPFDVNQMSADFIRKSYDTYLERSLFDKLVHLAETGDSKGMKSPKEIWNIERLSKDIKEVLSERYPYLKPYLNEGRTPDDGLREFLFNTLGHFTPLQIPSMNWFQGVRGVPRVWGKSPNKNPQGVYAAGKSVLNYMDKMPRFSMISETNTSMDSELLKLKGALKNYGTGPGQTTVERLPGLGIGNTAHVEGIYLEDVLEEVKASLPKEEYDVLKELIEKRRLGDSGYMPTSSLTRFKELLKDYYNNYIENNMAKPMREAWDRIIKKDPRYSTTTITSPAAPPYSPTVLNRLLDDGDYKPYVYRTNVAVFKHASGGPLNKFQDGGKKANFVELKEFPTYSSWEENVAANWPVAPKSTIDYEEIKRRQRWAESQDTPDAKSGAGAKGLFQIMPSTHKEYVAKTGKKGNIYDPKYNTEIRDWYMQDMLNSRTITNGNPTDSVQLAKQLAAYNWGRGNLGSFLEKQKKAGIDIYNNLDWINAMPKEPRDYVNFILRNKDTGGPRNNELYNSRPKIFLEY